MQLHPISGEPILEHAYQGPKTPQAAREEAQLHVKVAQGIEVKNQLSSEEGRRFIGMILDQMADQIDSLSDPSRPHNPAEDSALIGALKSSRQILTTLGIKIKLGRMASQRLAAKDIPIESILHSVGK